MAFQPQRDNTNKKAQQRGDHAGQGESNPERHLVVDRQNADGVGTHGHEAGVRKIELAGVASDQVETQGG